MLKQTKSKQQGFSHLLGIALIVVLVAIGSIGFFIYKKHQGKTAAHASSLEWKYGRYFELRNKSNDNYNGALLVNGYACKYNGYTISVLSFRLGLINSVSYGVDTSYGASSSAYSAWGMRQSSWWYNINLDRFSTVNSGHNFMGYNSAILVGDASSNNGVVDSYDTNLGATSTLPYCHY